MSEQRFYICRHCGNIVGLIKSSGVAIVCCGEKMELLKPNTVDASTEKHIPEVTIQDDKVFVTVGSVKHPMTEEHQIEWVYLLTKSGGQRKCLAAGNEPSAEFKLIDDEPVAVFAYCNLHGLWVKEL